MPEPDGRSNACSHAAHLGGRLLKLVGRGQIVFVAGDQAGVDADIDPLAGKSHRAVSQQQVGTAGMKRVGFPRPVDAVGAA